MTEEFRTTLSVLHSNVFHTGVVGSFPIAPEPIQVEGVYSQIRRIEEESIQSSQAGAIVSLSLQAVPIEMRKRLARLETVSFIGKTFLSRIATEGLDVPRNQTTRRSLYADYAYGVYRVLFPLQADADLEERDSYYSQRGGLSSNSKLHEPEVAYNYHRIGRDDRYDRYEARVFTNFYCSENDWWESLTQDNTGFSLLEEQLSQVDQEVREWLAVFVPSFVLLGAQFGSRLYKSMYPYQPEEKV